VFCKRGNHDGYQLNVNGQRRDVNVDPSTPLLWVLREELKMTGTKYGCGSAPAARARCISAARLRASCVLPVSAVGERPVVTIEASGRDPVGRAVQDAWVERDVVQCGYCQSGQIMSAGRATQDQTQTDGRERRGVDGRKSVPLRHLCAHSRGDPKRVQTAEIEETNHARIQRSN